MTPFPTLLPEEKLVQAEDLFRTNAGCRLPCWWGFTPGVAKWEEAKRFLAPFVHEIPVIGSPEQFFSEVSIQVPEEIYPGDFAGWIRNVYFVKDGIIEAIEIDIPLVSTYNLPVFLENYGPPDEMYVQTYPEEIEGWVDFSIYLFYEELGVFSYYHTQGEDLGDQIQGCFSDNIPGRLMVWAPDRNWTYEEVVDKMVGFVIDENTNFPLEEVTDFDAKSFYKTFIDTENTICITVPKRILTRLQRN